MSTPPSNLRAKVRDRLPEPVVDRLRNGSALRRRVQALEDEVQENRQLNRRIAELTDIVAELLIPLEARDHAKVEELLQRYQRGL